MKRLALHRTPREANSGTNPGLVNSKAHAPELPHSRLPRRAGPYTPGQNVSPGDRGRDRLDGGRLPPRSPAGQASPRNPAHGRVLGRLALGRASGALAPQRPRGRQAWAPALGRREVRRDPSAQAKTSPKGTARSTARIPLSPRGAVFASQRSEVSGARHPSLSGVPRGHPARPCTPRVSPLGDTGTEKGISAADWSRHYPPLLPLRLTFKPRQNGAAARLRPGRMHKDLPPVLLRTTVMI
ncbi:translation initiation factor IF-2-like [Lontra canadensis]|uniref:translation initiation factor IF-2-like n=1 Tax=Lontra canadensis TaxID=76717 RepID=UPI0013F32E78|nr:translation initiation factor IF-2-like [Lontra canadensis]